ncbi:MAG: GNAT family N-acetyltransferase [Cellvibrionaceae bacterium]
MNIEPYLNKLDSELLSLLLLADPKEESVKQYVNSSEIFVASSGQKKIGMAVLSINNNDYELKNIAVHPKYQKKGIAKKLIGTVKSRAKELGAQTLIVGTGNSSFDQLALYQKCGFKISTVKPNFFATYEPPIYENGIQCIDMIVLKAEL